MPWKCLKIRLMIEWNIRAVDKHLYGVLNYLDFWIFFIYSAICTGLHFVITYGSCDDLQKLRITSAYLTFSCVVLLFLCVSTHLFLRSNNLTGTCRNNRLLDSYSLKDHVRMPVSYWVYCISLEMVPWYKYKSIKKGTQQSVLCSKNRLVWWFGACTQRTSTSLNKACYDWTSVLNPIQILSWTLKKSDLSY